MRMDIRQLSKSDRPVLQVILATFYAVLLYNDNW